MELTFLLSAETIIFSLHWYLKISYMLSKYQLVSKYLWYIIWISIAPLVLNLLGVLLILLLASNIVTDGGEVGGDPDNSYDYYNWY